MTALLPPMLPFETAYLAGLILGLAIGYELARYRLGARRRRSRRVMR